MVASYIDTVRHFGRNVRLYMFATALMGFTYDGGIYAVIFNLYLLRLGYGPAFVGQVNAAGMLAFAVCAFPAGALGERWGNWRMLLIGLWVMLGGSLLLTLVEWLPPGGRPAWLVLMYVVMNVGLSLYFVNCVPYLMMITSVGEHNAAFSVQSALISLAAFAGSLLAGFLPGLFVWAFDLAIDDPAPYRYPLVVASLLFTTGIWAILSSRPSARSRLEPSASITDIPTGGNGEVWRVIGLLTFIRLLLVSGSAVAMIFFNVYMDDGLGVPTEQIGIAISIGRLIAAPAALLTPLLALRLGNARITMLASLGVAIFLIPLALAPVWYAATLGYVGAMTMTSIRYPAFMVYTMSLIPPRFRSVVAGAGEMAAGLAFAALAFAGGFIIIAGGYQPLFLLGAVLNLAGTVALGLFVRWRLPMS